VVPACRSLDCVSVFARSADDARTVFATAHGVTDGDPYGRAWQPLLGADGLRAQPARPLAQLRFGTPRADQLEFFGDESYRTAWGAALERLRATGARVVEIDFAPFLAAARLLYDGPWVAERLCELERFVTEAPGALLPVIRDILLGAAGLRATDAFAGLHELARCRRDAEAIWASVDVLVVPTVPDVPTLAEVAAHPIAANARLGRYTHFVNLLDLAALAVPNGFRGDGLSTGITLIGPWGHDARLAGIGAAFHRAAGGTLGATPWRLPEDPPAPRTAPSADELAIAVVGAHLSGQPLNPQLTARRARLLGSARTAPAYRLHALAGAAPARPGLVRVAAGGARIELEIWAMPRTEVGAFVAVIPPPLCLGAIELDTGERVTGFLCEAHALPGARDITEHGGWRAYLRSVGA